MGNYAFIDSQNVNLAIRAQGWKLDFGRLRTYLREKYGVEKAYLFVGYISNNEQMYQELRGYGYEMVFKPVSYGPDGKIKGNVDGELILHTMIEYMNFDQAVIVSGDGDFACLVEYLGMNSKLHVLLVPNKYRYSSLLKKSASGKMHFMNRLRIRLENIG